MNHGLRSILVFTRLQGFQGFMHGQRHQGTSRMGYNYPWLVWVCWSRVRFWLWSINTTHSIHDETQEKKHRFTYPWFTTHCGLHAAQYPQELQQTKHFIDLHLTYITHIYIYRTIWDKYQTTTLRQSNVARKSLCSSMIFPFKPPWLVGSTIPAMFDDCLVLSCGTIYWIYSTGPQSTWSWSWHCRRQKSPRKTS